LEAVVPKVAQASPRIESLDGLRAIAILLVVYGHARGTPGFPAGFRDLTRVGDVAELGVRFFFAISGFLITSLLAAELRKTSTLRLGSFYARRAFRIFPAYYFYLGVFVVLSLAGVVSLPWRDALLAATYLSDFQGKRAWVVGHTWSLSVEEQFYLVWPLALRMAGLRRGLWIALAVFALGPVIRLAWAVLLPSVEHRNMIAEAFPTVADSLATGCALMLAGPRLSASERYLNLLRSPVLVPALLAVLFACVRLADSHYWLNWLVLESVSCVCVALVIDRYVRYPGGPVGRALNFRPLMFVGTISYSLYLWQQPFLVQAPLREDTPVWFRFPLNLGLACVAALGSYYLIEKPFLRLRDRVLRPGHTGK